MNEVMCWRCGWHGSTDDPLRNMEYTGFKATDFMECADQRKCRERERENQARRTGGYTDDPAADYGFRWK